jgi:NADP-dependent aldehyde dehydrogenase
MTVQPSQGHEPGDTPPEELDRLIGAAAEAACELVGPRPSDRAGWLEHLATRLDAAADDLVSIAKSTSTLKLWTATSVGPCSPTTDGCVSRPMRAR